MSSVEDWSAIQTLAMEQGLSAVVLDGISYLKIENGELTIGLSQEELLQWIGEVEYNYERYYATYKYAISSLARFYNEHGFKMMVLKGYACSLDWPKPSHRPCGDIDIWQFGKQKEADEVVAREKGIAVDKSHHHHTVFNWGEFTVENHYDFVNVHARRSSAEMEKVFKELGNDDSYYVELMDGSTGSATKVYLPSPNLHALFLIKHMVSHFSGSNITLRQVLDWAFFVEKHTKEIDWEWLHRIIAEFHMKDFVNCINAICVEDLGFDANIFHGVQFIPDLKDRVFLDIMEPAFATEEPAHLIPRVLYKYRRWKGNGWKHELCYNESRWSSFWTGIWAKILKPASF